jgi:hypothetical protein
MPNSPPRLAGEYGDQVNGQLEEFSVRTSTDTLHLRLVDVRRRARSRPRPR